MWLGASSGSPAWRRRSTETSEAKSALAEKSAGARPHGDAPVQRFRFFGGKGGVGKTTCALAHALGAAERARDRRVLVISTDPAHSLADALDLPLPGEALPLATRRGSLEVLEMNAEQALDRWFGAKRPALRTAAERGTYLDREDLDQLLDASFPGADELIGLLEVTRTAAERRSGEVVIDTAPTGHALRLLEMPTNLARLAEIFDGLLAKHRYLFEALGGAHRPDSVERAIEAMAEEAEMLRALLVRPERCAFTWVLIPEALAIEETRDGIRELESLGIRVDEVIVNRLTPREPGCPVCEAQRSREQRALEAVADLLSGRRLRVVPVAATEPRGLGALRRVGAALERAVEVTEILPGGRERRRGRKVASPAARARAQGGSSRGTHARPCPEVVDAVAPPGMKLIIVGGKGGVGKTSVASALGLSVAARDPRRRVLLLSIDPAHSLGDALAVPLGDSAKRVPGAPPKLFFRELDARRAHERFRDRYLVAIDDMFARLSGGSRFEVAFDRAVLRDLVDLAPPGLDEIVALLSVLDAVVPGRDREGSRFDVAILDTAPTGHALRFLALPSVALEWIRVLMRIVLKYRELMGLGELAEELLELARGLRALRALLADPAQSTFIAVTRATALARLETERLSGELARLEVPLGAVLVNGLAPEACARCTRVAKAEAREVQRLEAAHLGAPLFSAPRLPEPPRGVEALTRFAETWRSIQS